MLERTKDIRKDIEEEIKEIVEKKREGNLFRKNKYMYQILLPFWKQIIWDHHNHELTSHLEYTQTHELIIKNY